MPLLPDGTEWPRFSTPEGTERPLSFIVQIDCAEIPEEGRLGLMPSRGLLQFFLELEWGKYWQWRVLHVDADSAVLSPATPPADLPKLYGSRDIWQWMQRDEEWPTLLPRFSFDPVIVFGRSIEPPADEDEAWERKLWPGTIDMKAELKALDSAIVDSSYFENQYDEAGKLVRPFANFPHDWRAVSIALGHLTRQLGHHHVDRFVKRGDMTQDDADRFMTAARQAIATWTDRAAAHEPFAPLSQIESDSAWQLFLDYQKIALFGLSYAVNDSLDATLAGSTDPLAVIPPEAVDLARQRHALGSRGKHGVHIDTPDRMLAPPACPQVEAGERVDQWLLLLEMSSNDGVGHHFGEGVYQFWILPDDLKHRRFERVVLTAEAY